MAEESRYSLVRLIQRGGMAELYEGRVLGEHGFQRRVAIKCLLPEHASDAAQVEGFVAEAKLVSHLHHANIVGVFDFGLMDGVPFQVLEFVDGLDLRTLFSRTRSAGEPLPTEVALHIAVEIAEALEYAHLAKDASGKALGIIHRDVSPENILVSWSGEVKLADFGIARSQERRGPTSVAVARGKLAYMAPEHQRGEALDHRADIFSLGCVLHEALAGKSPIAYETARREVLAGGPCLLDASLPEDVRAILGRAAHTARGSRYATASAMALDCGLAINARVQGDQAGRAALRAFMRRFKEPDPASPVHRLDELMNVELVLKDGSNELKRFESVVREPATELSDTGTPAPGRERALTPVIRGYRIFELLGRGGFAEIYRARDLALGVDLAIKILRPTSTDIHALRLRREASALRALEHPNLVKIVDFGTTEDGRVFMAMELVRGRTLRQAIDGEAPFSAERTRRIALGIAEGLAEVHRRGFVHRDLKPTNVMLVNGPGGERVKILDFGLAVLVGDEAVTRLTAAGRVVGTPSWMSPEQISGQCEIGPAADLYALGAILYAMIAGGPPFRGTREEVVRRHLVDKPKRVPGMPFESIIFGLLEKDPARRPKSAEEVIALFEGAELPTSLTRLEAIDSQVTEVPTLEDSDTPQLDRTPVLDRTRARLPTTPASIAIGYAPTPRRTSPLLWLAFLGSVAAASIAVWLQPGASGRPPEGESPPLASPMAVARPRAEALQEPKVASSVPGSATPVEARTPASRRSDAVLVALDAAVRAALAERGLREADLEAIPTTRAPARAWNAARTHENQAQLEHAKENLVRAIRALPADGAELQARLMAAREALTRVAATASPAKVEELERRYLDLRARLVPEMAPLDRATLAASVAGLLEDIRAAE